MRRLECGCEQSPEGYFLSLCEAHGSHVKQRLEAAKHPRAAPSPAKDSEYERELVLAIAPVMVAKVVAADANTTAQAIFAHVQEIMRRLE